MEEYLRWWSLPQLRLIVLQPMYPLPQRTPMKVICRSRMAVLSVSLAPLQCLLHQQDNWTLTTNPIHHLTAFSCSTVIIISAYKNPLPLNKQPLFLSHSHTHSHTYQCTHVRACARTHTHTDRLSPSASVRVYSCWTWAESWGGLMKLLTMWIEE